MTDPVALAKALTKIAKDVPAFRFKAGVVEGRVLSIQEIEQLSQLPSKEELISKIMFLVNAPAQRVASAMAGVSRNLAVVRSRKRSKPNKFAQLNEEEKETAMANNTDAILEQIKGLTLLEAADLVKKMEEAFGVSAAAAAPVAAAGGAAGGAAPAEEKTEFSVVLTEVGANKINVIKAVREVTSLGLRKPRIWLTARPNPLKKA